MNLSEAQKIDYIRLALSENVGPITFNVLMKYFGSASEALAHIDEFAKRGGRSKPITIASVKVAETQLKQAEEIGGHIVAACEYDYPDKLKHIEDSPPILFAKGHLVLGKKCGVGIVGTRNASLNARNLTRKIAHDLCQKDYVIVSGMAKGIDTAAHQGALAETSGNGGTIAVLGTPINQVYPAENQALYEELCVRGLILSELPFGTKTAPQNFPRRNRIISGLSDGVLVVEAQSKSGSLITAKYAVSQGKKLFAVPGSPLDPRSEGPNRLIKSGALITENADDIINGLRDISEPAFFENIETEFIVPTPKICESDLVKAREIVLGCLSPQATGVDEIIRETGLSAQSVNIVLVELELAGRLERHAGNRVALLFE